MSCYCIELQVLYSSLILCKCTRLIDLYYNQITRVTNILMHKCVIWPDNKCLIAIVNRGSLRIIRTTCIFRPDIKCQTYIKAWYQGSLFHLGQFKRSEWYISLIPNEAILGRLKVHSFQLYLGVIQLYLDVTKWQNLIQVCYQVS